MVRAQPHFLLFCDTHISERGPGSEATEGYRIARRGRWHFVLERLDGPERLEATDSEGTLHRDRLALLSVVRGLEALEQPSQVTLVTTSRYVSRGLRYGLSTWREADYTWERFGVRKPVRNADLWQRIDVAMKFHGVSCRLIQPQPIGDVTGRSLVGDDGCSATSDRMVGTTETSSESDQQEFADTRHGGALSPAFESFGRLWSQQPLSPARQYDSPSLAATWWQLAIAWIRWWRGRMQTHPAFYGA